MTIAFIGLLMVLLIVFIFYHVACMKSAAERHEELQSEFRQLRSKKLAKEYDLPNPELDVTIHDERTTIKLKDERVITNAIPLGSSNWGEKLNQVLQEQFNEQQHLESRVRLLEWKTTPECTDAHILVAEDHRCIRCGKAIGGGQFYDEVMSLRA